MLFSSFIHKTNRFNKCSDRAILITDWAIYKLEIPKFKPMKKGMPIQEVNYCVINIELFVCKLKTFLFIVRLLE